MEISIHNRPEEINGRSQFGNWEGDLMIFERAQGNANVATLIEREKRYVVLLRNNDPKLKAADEPADRRNVAPAR